MEVFWNLLQAISATIWFILFPLWLTPTIYLFFCTRFWPVVVIYFVWIYYDRETPTRGGRKIWLIRALPIWKWLLEYFPIRLVKTTDLSPERNYLFCIFPHGILSVGKFGNFFCENAVTKKLFPNLEFHGAAIDGHYYYPFYRDFVMGLGYVASSWKSLSYLMDERRRGNVAILAVGGSEEVFHARPGQYHIVLKKRKGFIKLALTTGCSLVPVISFGEVDIFNQVTTPVLKKLQDWLLIRTGLAWCIPIGLGFLLKIIPMRRSITTIVGKPIEVPKNIDPSPQQIEHYHSIFTKELIDLFNGYKEKYIQNAESTELLIVA